MPPRTTINPEGISETRVPFTFDELKIDMSSWNVDGFTYDQVPLSFKSAFLPFFRVTTSSARTGENINKTNIEKRFLF